MILNKLEAFEIANIAQCSKRSIVRVKGSVWFSLYVLLCDTNKCRVYPSLASNILDNTEPQKHLKQSVKSVSKRYPVGHTIKPIPLLQDQSRTLNALITLAIAYVLR